MDRGGGSKPSSAPILGPALIGAPSAPSSGVSADGSEAGVLQPSNRASSPTRPSNQRPPKSADVSLPHQIAGLASGSGGRGSVSSSMSPGKGSDTPFRPVAVITSEHSEHNSALSNAAMESPRMSINRRPSRDISAFIAQRRPSRSFTNASSTSSRAAIGALSLAGMHRGDSESAMHGADGSDEDSASGATTPAGSELNSRRPSRIIDPSELQRAVVTYGQLATMERSRSQKVISSHEYSDTESCNGASSPRHERHKPTAHVAYLAPYERQAKRQSLAQHLHCLEPSPRQIAVTWVVTVVIAAVTAFECAGILMLSAQLQRWRLDWIAEIVRGGTSALAFLPLLGYALPVSFVGAALVVFLGAPRASGSGIPDLKAFLNGNGIPGLFTFRTWLARSVGLILVTSAGLFAGMEGPCAQIGAITAYGIARLAFSPSVSRGMLTPMGHRTTCEFVAQGCAIGVASAFGAPVGGILFSLEEATSFWSKTLTWRSFVGCMIAAALAKSANAKFELLPVSGFIEFPDPDVDFAFWELGPFVILAMSTGILGALFCMCAEQVMLARRHFYARRGPRRREFYQVAEVLLMATVTMTLIFWVPFGFGCQPLTYTEVHAGDLVEEHWHVGKLSSTICPEGQYSDIGVLLIERKEVAIKALFTDSFEGGAKFRIESLLLSTFLIIMLTMLTHVTAIPAGLFVPNILIGSCLGRAAGQLFAEAFGYKTHAGVYAIIGTVGMLAGYSRMTVSLAMITLEITQSMRLLLPVTLTILVSKGIADMIKVESLYDLGVALHPLGNITLLHSDLDEEDLPLLRLLTAHDACSVEVQTLKCEETPSHIMATLMQTRFSGFPLVSMSGMNAVVGLVLRDRLLQALKDHNQGVDVLGTSVGSERSQTINLLPYADQTPEVKHWNTPLVRTFLHFTSAGLRHLCLVDESHRLVGILTRSDLAPLCHPRTRSSTVHLLLLRKQAALQENETDEDAAMSHTATSDSCASNFHGSMDRFGQSRSNTWWFG